MVDNRPGINQVNLCLDLISQGIGPVMEALFKVVDVKNTVAFCRKERQLSGQHIAGNYVKFHKSGA